MKMDPWLSPLMGMDPMFIPSSFKRVFIQTACQLQFDKAIYLASVEIVQWFFVHETARRTLLWLSGRNIQFEIILRSYQKPSLNQ